MHKQDVETVNEYFNNIQNQIPCHLQPEPFKEQITADKNTFERDVRKS